jgi:predicted GNAT family acetyltransferase
MADTTDDGFATVNTVSSLLRRHQEPGEPGAPQPLRLEVVHDSHRQELTELVDADPVVNAVISARLRAFATLDARVFGGPLLGVWRTDAVDGADTLCGAVFRGGNILPIGGAAPQWQALAEAVGREPRRCSSIVGRAEAVRGFWAVLRDAWGPARAIRTRQPLLAVDRSHELPQGDPRVRVMRPDELDVYLPAAVDMFTAELGISPLSANAGVGSGDYRRRVLGLIREGRALGVRDADGGVIFKADLGTISPHTCQVQGVWVRPDRRGRGLGTAALASVLRYGLTLAPTVSLYVNDYNVAARQMYERLGMRHTADLSTILF